MTATEAYIKMVELKAKRHELATLKVKMIVKGQKKKDRKEERRARVI